MTETYLIDPQSAVALAIFAIAIWIKGLLLSWVQVRARFRARAFARPEDARMLRLQARAEPAIVARAADAWRNELENGPAFFAVAAGYVLTGAPHHILLLVFVAFFLARAVHSVATVSGLQPLRTIAWLTSVGITAWLVFLTLMRVAVVLA
jgi:uncharacterized MAPEG superfamily protein